MARRFVRFSSPRVKRDRKGGFIPRERSSSPQRSGGGVDGIAHGRGRQLAMERRPVSDKEAAPADRRTTTRGSALTQDFFPGGCSGGESVRELKESTSEVCTEMGMAEQNFLESRDPAGAIKRALKKLADLLATVEKAGVSVIGGVEFIETLSCSCDGTIVRLPLLTFMFVKRQHQ